MIAAMSLITSNLAVGFGGIAPSGTSSCAHQVNMLIGPLHPVTIHQKALI